MKESHWMSSAGCQRSTTRSSSSDRCSRRATSVAAEFRLLPSFHSTSVATGTTSVNAWSPPGPHMFCPPVFGGQGKATLPGQ